jgi:MoxR-like ATPase
MSMDYTKIFDPEPVQSFQLREPDATVKGDVGDRSVYVYSDDIVLAVNVALATGRPLLIRGPSGGGKSSLALNVARVLKRRFYEKVISSRTQARDLLWEVDHLRRLQDAQTRTLKPDFSPYINPGVFWWAFDRQNALKQRNKLVPQVVDQNETGENTDVSESVVLLDEIDKADPDVPNNLLVPLGSLSFTVDETGEVVSAKQTPLVFVTTNEERQLPVAFLRRCVELKLKNLNKDDLVKIGRAHFPAEDPAILQKVAKLILSQSGAGAPPSAAEYLDTARACLNLKIDPDNDIWQDLSKITVWKHGRTPGRST